MAERLPKLIAVKRNEGFPVHVSLVFDAPLSRAHSEELYDLVSLKFAGQLRRDPNAPQTAPPEPSSTG